MLQKRFATKLVLRSDSISCVDLRTCILIPFIMSKLRVACWALRKAVMVAETVSFPITQACGVLR